MNTPLTVTREKLLAALDAVQDPVNGAGLVASGALTALEIAESGKVVASIEAPADKAALYENARKKAEETLKAQHGVTQAIVVVTAHEAKPATPKGLANVKVIIAVASAKGGVGKSSVAVNLACAFAALGKKTGLLDIDVYGPSAPTLLGVSDQKPRALPDKSIEPIKVFGLTTMSIGYLVNAETAMVWRGAMATSAVRQMLEDVVWGELDVLVLDLPPGTGDVQLTLAQRAPLTGAVIVSTPQEMALADVRRGIQMFEKTHTPVLGVIENMAYFVNSDGTHAYIFGQGGARKTAEDVGVPFLGELPIDVSLRESCDAGAPLVATQPDHPMSKRFIAFAEATLVNAASAAKTAPIIRFE
ncbi:MAG: Mrp/NBP35 family ATP-binding protein [Caulobacterales bacterium]